MSCSRRCYTVTRSACVESRTSNLPLPSSLKLYIPTEPLQHYYKYMHISDMNSINFVTHNNLILHVHQKTDLEYMTNKPTECSQQLHIFQASQRSTECSQISESSTSSNEILKLSAIFMMEYSQFQFGS